MNDLYGIDPAAPSGPDDLISLLRLFGPTEGRFIADFPLDWLEEVRAALEGYPPLQRDRALEWLHRRRHALVNTDRRYLPGRKWAENAQALGDVARALIGPRGCAATLIPIDHALYETDTLPDARGDHVARSSSAYVKTTWPLLAISSKVVLVDFYLRLRGQDARQRDQAARHRRVLVDILAEAQRRRKTSVFCVHISKTTALDGARTAAQFSSDLQRVREEAGAVDIAMEHRLLDDVPGLRQHARYILGRGCGIQFDHGFDTANDGSRNHVHWLSASEVGPLLKKFDLPDF